MPTNLTLIILILAGLAWASLLLIFLASALAMSGHLSELERQAEIAAALGRQAENAADKDQQC